MLNPRDRVAVWLISDAEPPENEAEVVHALTSITGDPLKAYYLISGRDDSSACRGTAWSRRASRAKLLS